MVRISFAVAVIVLGVTPVLLLAAMIVNGPSPLLGALWPLWAVIVIGAVLIYRTAKHGPPSRVRAASCSAQEKRGFSSTVR